MLDDLRRALAGKQIVTKEDKSNVQRIINLDNQIAVNIIDKLVEHINKSIRLDRSSVKLNMLEKGGVSQGMKRVLPGTKTYLENMFPADIKELLDDIENELKKRKRI
jgi:hypothetical protein